MCDAIRSIVPLLVNADAPLARPARRGAEHVLEVVIPTTDECVAELVCIASMPCRMDVYGTKASYACHGDDRLYMFLRGLYLRQSPDRRDSGETKPKTPLDDRYREAPLLFAGRAGSGRGAADRGERAGIPTVRGRVGGDVAQVGRIRRDSSWRVPCASLDLSHARSLVRSFARQKHGPMVVGGRRRRPALRPSVSGGRIRCDDGVYTLV